MDEMYIECSFVKAFYKIIRGTPLSWHDIEDYDNKFYENLKWMLTNDATLLMRTFSETIDYFGVQKTIELMPGGA